MLSEIEQMIPSEAARQDFEKGEIAREINVFLSGLKKESRIYFVRRYWYSDSIADIAKHYGVNHAKIKSSLFRTRNALRKHLEREGIEI
ncbi:MAG: hypothetical protein LUE88_05735 [Clostridiales bacterium]|nr:hypothetical protein [Clostridiales bacterium]